MHLVMKAENACIGLSITLVCTVSLAGVAVIPRITIATLVVLIVRIFFPDNIVRRLSLQDGVLNLKILTRTSCVPNLFI